MAAPLILVEAAPRQTSNGEPVTMRLAGGGGQLPYYYGGQHWRHGIVQLPTFVTAIDFGNGDAQAGEFGAGGVPQALELQWAPASMALLAEIASHYWPDAPISIYVGPETGATPPLALTGKVLSANVSGGVLTIALSDPVADLKKPLLTERYGGSGDLDGPAEWAGVIKRRIWGRVWNVAGDPLDQANNIYCFADPLRPIDAITAVRDRGAAAASLSTLAWQGSAIATLTALRSAVAPQGGGVVCPSIASVKWWTKPTDLAADLRGEIGAGYVETTAQIVQRIVEAGADLPFASGSVAAAAAARPAPVGWVAGDDTTSQAAMIEELLGNSSLLWLLNAAGEIVLRPWAWGASAASARSIDVKRTGTLKPVGTRQIGYRRNEHVVQRAALAGIVLAQDTQFEDGATLESLKPAEPGATAGAPAGTMIGDRTVEAVLASLDDAEGGIAVRVEISKPSAQIYAYANGTVISFAPAAGQLKVYRGSLDVTADAVLTSSGSAGLTGSINAAGAYSVTALTGESGTLTLTAVYDGQTLVKPFVVNKAYVGYEIVSSLPASNLFAGRMVFLTTDNKLYRYTGSAWTAAVPASDVTGQLTDAQLAAIAAAKITGTITGAQIASGAVAGTHFASGLEPVTVVASVPGGLLTQTVFNTADRKLYRWNGSAYVATVPAGDISGTLADAQLAAISAAKVTGLLSDSQLAAIAAAKITGQIGTTQITNGAISTPKLAAGAVTSAEIAADTIVAGNIAAGAVTASELAAGAVIAGKIAAGTIVAGDIAAGTITGDRIAASTITAGNIASDTITAGQIAAGAVTASELAAGAVTAGKIAANAVTATEIAAGSVSTAKLAAGAVTAGELAAGAVTTPKIAAGAITASELAANSVTANAIGAGEVTAAKLAATNLITLSAQIMDGVITNAKIANLSVDSAKIADLTIGTEKITANAAAKIAYVAAGLTYLNNGVEAVCATLTVTKDRADSVLKISVHANARLQDNARRTNRIRVNGDVVWSSDHWPAGDDTTYNTESYAAIIAGLGAGNHTIEFTATLSMGATFNFSYMSQTFLDVEERKR